MRITFHRKIPVVLAVAASGLLATACDSGAGAVEDTQTTDAHAGHTLSHAAALQAPANARDAFTYNPRLAPVGAEMAIEMAPSGNSTTFSLEVTGMRPNRGYAAHAHTDKCAADPAASGGHYQNEPAPEDGSETPDPKFVNPENEFWLDFETDAEGNGSSTVTVDFEVTDWDRPRSVVVHSAQKTSTAPGEAGVSGDRVACLSLPHSH
ncbi:superoxide dismutase family protein [Haloechinothrix halophila]|uniref:superoxide dismutase family protein n=1 Tax=Haloechinothrix halophila TaxID=1069073 RepID=UPI00041CB279|nr:superoxide dismutase family protein [Haloechinothrix halophila]